MTAIWRNRTYRSAIILVLITFFLHFLESRGYLHGLQMAFGLDPMVRGAASNKQMDVSVVTIDEADYRTYFCGRSPLDGRALLALVKGVEETLHPQVIGVDIDTSDWNGGPPDSCPIAQQVLCGKVDPKQCLTDAKRLLPEQNNSPESAGRKPPNGIVWAQVPGEAQLAATEQPWWAPAFAFIKVLWTGEPEESMALPLRQVAGQDIPADVPSTGIPRFPLDPDGVVRRYRRRFPVVERYPGRGTRPPELRYMDSLPYALVKALRSQGKTAQTNDNGQSESQNNTDPGDETILRFLTDPQVLVPIEAQYLMPSPAGQAAAPSPSEDQIKKALQLRPNRIVIIGGSFKEARDTYRTPVGEMPGVALIAQAVETELQGGFHEINGGLKMFGDLLAGGLLIWLWGRYPRSLPLGWVFFLSLVGIGGLAWLISNGLFIRWGIWFDSVAVMVGVLFHQVLEELEKVSELKKEVDERDETIRELEQDLKVLAATHGHTAGPNPVPPDKETC